MPMFGYIYDFVELRRFDSDEIYSHTVKAERNICDNIDHRRSGIFKCKHSKYDEPSVVFPLAIYLVRFLSPPLLSPPPLFPYLRL